VVVVLHVNTVVWHEVTLTWEDTASVLDTRRRRKFQAWQDRKLPMGRQQQTGEDGDPLVPGHALLIGLSAALAHDRVATVNVLANGRIAIARSRELLTSCRSCCARKKGPRGRAGPHVEMLPILQGSWIWPHS